jgi:hypothetical protein
MLARAMDRRPPRTTSDEIDLYIRTYYSLLRSTGEVRVRAFEEAHSFSDSSLHSGARDQAPDLAAFAYSAARLPDCFARVQRLVLGQSPEQFDQAGLPFRGWQTVRARGRRRAMRWDGDSTLAVFITSASDVDDLVPIVTAYQIEWNKIHALLRVAGSGEAHGVLRDEVSNPGGRPTGSSPEASRSDPSQSVRGGDRSPGDEDQLLERIGLSAADAGRLRAALGVGWREAVAVMARRPSDLSVRLLYGSFSQYQTSAQRWWRGIERPYLAAGDRRRPIYFVSSNTHSLTNLLGGYALGHRSQITDFARKTDPEGLAAPLDQAVARGDEGGAANLLYYLLRAFLDHGEEPAESRLTEVQRYDGESGIQSIETPGRIDVSAQLIELRRLRPDRLDPRVRVAGLERLAESDALILNIDYPLGLAAYHHLARIAQGVSELRGIYVMGKAATLNGRVGDVMVSSSVYDEHSRNTYLMRNCFSAADVQPYMQQGTVLDNQKAVTVRSAFLQNRDYMSLFYAEGYTVLEMEAGPYLSAVYEIISPERHPIDEIVNLSNRVRFDVGILHYASDTPYSRRQSLLSKSMSYFGVESTYACAIAIARRILELETSR